MLSLRKRQYNNISFYDICQDLSSPTLIILHGWLQNKESWERAITIFSRDFRVICPDLPGFGESTKDQGFYSFSPDDYADCILNLMIYLKVGEAILLGHSFGGRIAIVAAGRYPQRFREVILYAPGNKHNLIYSFKLLKIAKKMSLLLPNIIQQYVAEKFRSTDYRNSGILKNIFLKAVNFDFQSYLSKIDSPTLLIIGNFDSIVSIDSVKLLKRDIRNSKLVIVKSYGHFIHLENPFIFCGIVKRFINNSKNAD